MTVQNFVETTPVARFAQDGEAIPYTSQADVHAGDVFVLGNFVAVAKVDIKAGDLGALSLEGAFDFPKATSGGSGAIAGTKWYWIASTSQATTAANSGGQSPTAYAFIGKSILPAADADTTVRVRLSPDV